MTQLVSNQRDIQSLETLTPNPKFSIFLSLSLQTTLKQKQKTLFVSDALGPAISRWPFSPSSHDSVHHVSPFTSLKDIIDVFLVALIMNSSYICLSYLLVFLDHIR